MFPTAGSYRDIFDEDQPIFTDTVDVDHPDHGAIRLPDGRALAWAEYGSARGMPCILIPDAGSSRLAPGWLLHDSALPSSVRLLALDRPGTGASDPVGLGGRDDPAGDLARLVSTLAVGRVAVIGIGQGMDEAVAFAAAAPHLVTSVTGVSVRTGADTGMAGPLRRMLGRTVRAGAGALAGWVAAAGSRADLRTERTWTTALAAMSTGARVAVGERWQESDFRAAVAADVTAGGHPWAEFARPASEPTWLTRGAAVRRPVRLWHGQQESPTGLTEVRRIAAERAGWTVSAVAGPSATTGYWSTIIGRAADSFATSGAA